MPRKTHNPDDDEDLLGAASTSDGQPRPNSDGGTIDDSYNVTAQELRQFIERIETLEQEAKDIAESKKEVYAEAKGRGYDTKVMRKLISERKRDKDDLSEEQAVLEMYRAALGMS